MSRTVILEQFGLKKSTLSTWIRKRRSKDPFWVPTPRQTTQPPARCRVSEVRTVLRMLDEDRTQLDIRMETGHDRQTIRRWRDSPRFRNATLEYDPSFTYDHDDLLDRAVVAHHLCTETTDVGERLDLLMAAVGYGADSDEHSIPTRKTTSRSIHRRIH